MPIYEYKCQDCGEIFELLVLTKDEEARCKSCNGQNLEKLISAHNTVGSSGGFIADSQGSCCGSPNSCGNPGNCCSG
ncbi:MAG: Zinc ribbon domain protein [Syntrophorhabdus sp. PtaU1.Bin153]|nr:MAG: Zinc ribbon domain protein [Syntrophorhabdus sp. PtaU1.Bin153]